MKLLARIQKCSVNLFDVQPKVCVVLTLLWFGGCGSGLTPYEHAALQQAKGRRAEDFLIVDCLLPGEIRQLGQGLTYVSRRDAVKTSSKECEIRGGEYVALERANFSTALKVWLPLAEQGDLTAQNNVGEIFEKGLGVSADHKAAAVWYQRAAEKGFSRAAINLGGLYEQGLGVPKDQKQALSWYRRAAGLAELNFEIASDNQTAVVQQLQHQVAVLEAQLKAKQDELTTTQRELENLRRSLDQRRSDADSERREIARQRQELETLRKTQQGVSEEQIRDLQRSIDVRESSLAAKDKEIASLRATLARIEKDSINRRTELVQLQKQSADTPPQIHVIEPLLTVTRGISVAQVPSRTGSIFVIGRVDSREGVRLLTVNGREEKLDAESIFKTQIPLSGNNEPVRIVAVDRVGRRSSVDFHIPETLGVASLSAETAEPATGAKVPIGITIPPGMVSFGKYHALVIGNNNYRMMPRLETSVNDAREVSRVLRDRYGFNVTTLLNASRYDILAALNMLREKLSSDDNLLIYYAGHGELDRKNQRGNWLPIDAEPKSTANWISNTTITDILNAMSVKQLLVVADSCYSGTLTRSAVGRLEGAVSRTEALKVIQTMARQRSRMVLTSGGVEPVIDNLGGANSVFAKIFVELLQRNSGVLAGQELFSHLQLGVAAVAQRVDIRQVPEYAPIKYAGHECCDFFFVRVN